MPIPNDQAENLNRPFSGKLLFGKLESIKFAIMNARIRALILADGIRAERLRKILERLCE